MASYRRREMLKAAQDWTRLEKILAPHLNVKPPPTLGYHSDLLMHQQVDYSIVGHTKIDDLPAKDFLLMMSSPSFLGDPLVRTQHFIGASKYEKLSDTEIVGHYQIRAAHQRYTGPDMMIVENKGHGHSFIKHWYRKVDGVWKLSGLCPRVYWNEFDFEKIFVDLSAEH